jgi:hypothetical protein
MECNMRIKSFKHLLLVLLACVNTNVCLAEIIHVDKAIEAEKFLMFHSNPTGYVLARECAKCPELRFTTTADTQAIYNGRAVPLSSVPAVATTTMTVIYDPQSNVAKKILW